MSLVYLYDGSFDGLLTAVFDAFNTRRWPDAVAEEENLQVSFGQEALCIETVPEKARRVEKGIVTKLGSPLHQKIWKAYLSSEPDKGTLIYRYVRRAFSVGRRIYSDLAHPDVLALDRLYNAVGREAHALIEFLRFSQMEGGVYYARVTPEHCVVSLIMPHFVDRYSVQPFMIHDDTHQVAGIFGGSGWYMVETHDMSIPDITADELSFRRMWKRFYETIAIRERFNPRCRKAHLPKKYWQNMTEHNFIETPKTARIDAQSSRGLSHEMIAK